MARIMMGGNEITQQEAMRWFCWHEIVREMEKDQGSLRIAVNIPENIPDWENKVLGLFLELTDIDLHLGY